MIWGAFKAQAPHLPQTMIRCWPKAFSYYEDEPTVLLHFHDSNLFDQVSI